MQTQLCYAHMISRIYFYVVYTYTDTDPVNSEGLLLFCVFVGVEVCTHLLLCVRNLPQTGYSA